jgi:transposase
MGEVSAPAKLVAGQGTQRYIADRWGIDRSTVTRIIKLAEQGALERLVTSRPGRPGKSSAELALEDAQAEIERLKATVTEQAVELHLFQGNVAGADRRPRSRHASRHAPRPASRTGCWRWSTIR